MKFCLTILAFIFTSGFARAEYEPFYFQCVYDASSDGMITVTTDIDPDVNDLMIHLKSDLRQEAEVLEAEHVYIYRPDEIPAENQESIQKVLELLNIDLKEVFTFTEVKIPFADDRTFMTFYKVNSYTGDLGIGVHSHIFGNDYYTRCVQ